MRYRCSYAVGCLVAVLGMLLAARPGWSTTYNTITVDGNLADFATDEKTAGDSANDSLYGADNELTTFDVSWDDQKLYLGFDYKIQGGAVMVLLDTGKAGGVTNFCSAAGYTGSFKANIQGASFNLLVAFWADDASPATKPTVHIYSLDSKTSTEITSGSVASLVEAVSGNKRTGAVEVAIAWNAIYGLGASTVPSKAKIKIVSAMRGKGDGDGLGDVSPDPTAAVKNTACGGSDSNYLDKSFEVTIDSNGDGTPEKGWSPGSDTPATPRETGPTGDKGPTTDATITSGDGKPKSDLSGSSDAQAASDQITTSDKKVSKADTGKKPAKQEGCACGAAGRAGDGSDEGPGWLLLGLAALVVAIITRSSH